MSSTLVLFFFSSRRLHTRLTCDWSSDVCSSDLRYAAATHPGRSSRFGPRHPTPRAQIGVTRGASSTAGRPGVGHVGDRCARANPVWGFHRLLGHEARHCFGGDAPVLAVELERATEPGLLTPAAHRRA